MGAKRMVSPADHDSVPPSARGFASAWPGSAATAQADAGPAGARAGRSWLAVAAGLLVGLALRAAAVVWLSDSSSEWEAHGFLPLLEGWDWGAWNRLRPAGFSAWMAALGTLAPQGSLPTLRMLLATAGALASWTCLAAAVLALSGGFRGTHRSPARGLSWVTWLWALSPALLVVTPRPVPEPWVGSAACLLLASLALVQRRGGLLAWGAATAAATIFVLIGGVLAVATLVVGLAIYLLPVPRLSACAGPAAIVLVALACFWWAQRGPVRERPWLPDSGPIWSAAALYGMSPTPLNSALVDHDAQVRTVAERAWESLADGGPFPLVRDAGRRLVGDALNPRRFEEGVVAHAGPPESESMLRFAPLLAGLLEAFLRGGTLLFALAALRLWPSTGNSSFPRGAVAVGVILLAVASGVLACSPHPLVPFDMVLMALAAGAVSVAAPPARAQRRRAFTLGGLAFLVVPAVLWISGTPVSAWSRKLGQDFEQGRNVVTLLVQPASRGGEEAHKLGLLLMDGRAPFLRHPELALRHVELALIETPDGQGVLGSLVAALIENQRLEDAAQVAESLLDDRGELTPAGRILRRHVRDQERMRMLAPAR